MPSFFTAACNVQLWHGCRRRALCRQPRRPHGGGRRGCPMPSLSSPWRNLPTSSAARSRRALALQRTKPDPCLRHTSSPKASAPPDLQRSVARPSGRRAEGQCRLRSPARWSRGRRRASPQACHGRHSLRSRAALPIPAPTAPARPKHWSWRRRPRTRQPRPHQTKSPLGCPPLLRASTTCAGWRCEPGSGQRARDTPNRIRADVGRRSS
mmetsp:Transcript_72045/g.187513  ORF Transcript_72045/g.187513 Transcript_72045/m.187513 type:complete len:210 (+) Transcript_72045:287-916(+)